jgi:hypothetical protein
VHARGLELRRQRSAKGVSMSSKLRAELTQWAGDLDVLMNGRQHASKRWR